MVELESVAINGTIIVASVGAASFMFKKWMKEREETESELKKEVSMAIKEHMIDLKERISANRDFYSKTYNDLKEGMSRIEELQRIANGRTGKLETKVDIQSALCKERNERRGETQQGINLGRRCGDELIT